MPSAPAWLLSLFSALLLCGLVVRPGLSQERPLFQKRAVAELDSLRQQIDAEGLAGYAPSRFKDALRAYRDAKAALRENEDDDEVRERLNEARQALRNALQTARIAKTALSEVEAARKQLQYIPSFEENEDEFEDAGREFRDALQEAEKGDIEDAREHAAEVLEEYRAATRIALQEKDIEEAREALEAAEDRIDEATYDRADDELDRIEDEIEDAEDRPFDIASFYHRYRRHIRDAIIVIYPDFYQDPPDTLLVGDFTLVVDSFRTRHWDFDREQITGAHGTAWVSFACERGLRRLPVDLAPRTFEVVEEVTRPRQQISAETAREMEQQVEVGEEIRLAVPPDSLGQVLRPDDIPRGALRPRVPPQLGGGSSPPGDIKLSFRDLRIEPTGRPRVGRVVAGTSHYPTTPPTPTDATLDVAGFTLHLDQLEIAPKQSSAQIELEFPESIRDSVGHPARYDLGTLLVSPTCQLYKIMADSTYGPWTVGETGVEIEGRGLVADFSTQWKWAQAPASQSNAWRGVLLPSGRTIAATDTVRSNTGYLQADYDYTDAQITAQGLEARLDLTRSFLFRPLQPTGYLVTLRRGHLQMEASAVAGGAFSSGDVRLPRPVVRTAGAGRPAELAFDRLTVQTDLDLFGTLPSTTPLGWARPGTDRRFSPYYSLTGGGPRFFYLSGAPRADFRAAQQSRFGDPGLADRSEAEVADSAETHGVQGLILSRPGEATIHTPDTDGGRPITLPVDSGWVHVGGRGVNGLMVLRRDLPANPQLGETSNRLFESPAPFDFSLRRPDDTPTTLQLQFVESAVFESDGEGQIALGTSVQDSLAVRDVAITSTAQIPAVELDTTSHAVQLAYWGLDLVTQEGVESPGVASVKTGVIYLTGAGLAERRHFASPFYLIWGEILADGRFRTTDLEMDLNARDQAFDTFDFTPTTLNLSPYTPGGADTSYLQVGGTVHFEFFSAQHLHVIDRHNPDSTQAPFYGRYVTLADTAGRGGIAPTNQALRGNWSNGFARMQYALGYAEEAQNGFMGPGTMDLTVLFMDPLTSSFRAVNGRTCMNVREMNRADVRLGPVAHFGAATEIKGCACVSEQKDGELQRLALSASLMRATNLNVAIRSARYGELSFVHSPTVTDLRLHGDYSLGTIITDLAVNGSARFTVNHAENYVDGTLEGAFNTEAGSGLIAGASLQASGTLDWHLGAGVGGKQYQSLQGRVQTDMMGGNVLASAHAGAEGGFYVGINAPKSEAWVIQNADSRARVDMTPFPARLTGIYGYLQASMGINTILVGGGAETMVGLGLFGLTANQFANLDAQADPVQLVAQGATGTLIPYGVGKMWVHVWGEILKGALRAEGRTNLMLIGPRPFGFQGELTLGGCVAWVLCGDVTLGCGLNTSQNGFYVNTK